MLVICRISLDSNIAPCKMYSSNYQGSGWVSVNFGPPLKLGSRYFCSECRKPIVTPANGLS